MVNKSGNKGTYAETHTARYLATRYWPECERKRLAGRFDKGDITGTKGLAWEVKAVDIPAFPEWMRETEAERINAGADYGILVHKAAGVGIRTMGLWTAAMSEEQFDAITIQAYVLPGEIFRMTRKVRGGSVTSALRWARLESAGGPAAVLFETNNGIPNYVAMYLEDMVDLLNRAGYGTPREEAA